MNPSVFFPFLFVSLLATAHATSATLGDYRTKASGNWNQTSVWQYYNGSAWVNATNTPSYLDNNIDVLSGHTVSVTSNVTIDQTGVAGILNVNAGITLTINDGSSTDLSIANTVNVYGTLVNKGTISSASDELVFKSGSTYKHNQNGGSVPDATWNDDSYCEITGITSASSLLNTDQSFSDFIWNCASQTSECNLAGNLETIRGDLYISSTGSTGKLKMAESADYTLTISGNWVHSAGTLNMGGGSSYALINLLGNFSMTGGKITEGNSSGYYAKINFAKAGVQTYTKSSGTFENNIDFEIINGTTLDMGDQVVNGSLGVFSVSSGSTLRTSHAQGIAQSGATGCIQTSSRYYSLAAHYHYNRNGSQSTGNGLPSPLNGKITIGSTTSATNLTLTNGTLNVAGTLLLCSNNLANSTIVSGTISYGATVTLEYQGMSAQNTTVKEWPVASPPFHATINNGYGVVLTDDRTINGTLTLSAGALSIGNHTLTLNGTLTRVSGSLLGGTSSHITIGGTSPTALDLPDVNLGNLLLNRASGVRLTGNVTIAGILIMTNGQVTLQPTKTLSYLPGSKLKYNGSTVQNTAAGEFPATGGPPSLEIDKSGGTTLNLMFSRTLDENLHLTTGNFSIGNNTLTLSGLIVKDAGTLTGGSASNLFFGGSGIATSLPPVTLHDLTIQREAGIVAAGNITVENALILEAGSLSIEAFTLQLNGDLMYEGGSLSGGSLSVLSIGGDGGMVTLEPVVLHTLMLNRTNGLSLSGNVEVQHMFVLFKGPVFRNGFEMYGPSSTLCYQGNIMQQTTNEEFPAAQGPKNLVIANPSQVVLHDERTVSGNLELRMGQFVFSDQTLHLGGTIVAIMGNMTGGSTGNLEFIPGTGPALFPGAPLNDLVINRTEGVFSTGHCTVYGTVHLADGPLTIAGNGTLNLLGHPISGNQANCHADITAGLLIGGNIPGHQVPTGITTLGTLTIDNHIGVGLNGSLHVENQLRVMRSFNMDVHSLMGPGSAIVMPGAHLITAHPQGIAGNIQMGGAMMIDGAVDYTFNGTLNQTTSFMPTLPPQTIRNLEISNATPFNVVLDSDITVNGSVVITPGARLTIAPGKVMTLMNDLVIE